MRTKAEIKSFLEQCRAVSGYGMSTGPCPLKKDDVKRCQTMCTYDDKELGIELSETEREQAKKACCDRWEERSGCCAECSFPSALEWVLGNNVKGSNNGQQRLIQRLTTAEL